MQWIINQYQTFCVLHRQRILKGYLCCWKSSLAWHRCRWWLCFLFKTVIIAWRFLLDAKSFWRGVIYGREKSTWSLYKLLITLWHYLTALIFFSIKLDTNYLYKVIPFYLFKVTRQVTINKKAQEVLSSAACAHVHMYIYTYTSGLPYFQNSAFLELQTFLAQKFLNYAFLKAEK